MEIIKLFEPVFKGQRFEDHTLPFELLGDLSVYQSLLMQVAKDLFYEQNPDRKRVPSGFGNDVYLKLSKLEEGSTVAPILLAAATFMNGDFDSKPLYEQAQAKIEQTISAAASGKSVENLLSSSALEYFNKFGKNLRDDEEVIFNSRGINPSRLTQETRRILVLSSPSVLNFESRMVLRGSVSAISKDPLNFTVTTLQKTKLIIPIAKEEYKTVEQAYLNFENDLRVKIEGIGIYNRKNILESVKEVGSIVFLNALDVPTRLETFALYEDGWYNGEGTAYNRQDLKWLADQFDFYFQTDLLLPYVFPTPENGILLEWKQNGHDSTLEINLENKSAYYHYYNSNTNDFYEYSDWDFSNSATWATLIDELSKYFKMSGHQIQ